MDTVIDCITVTEDNLNNPIDSIVYSTICTVDNTLDSSADSVNKVDEVSTNVMLINSMTRLIVVQ